MVKRKQVCALLVLIYLMVTMLPISTTYAADAKFIIPIANVTASGNDGNEPKNVLDGNLTTRWSSNGDGEWIQFDLGPDFKKLAYVKLAFLNGDTRTSTFDIQASTDNVAFTTVRSNVTSSLSASLQTFDFTDVDPVRYVKLIGHGNSVNAWNSYTEVEIYGDASASTVPVDAKFTVPTVSISDSGNDGNVPANTVDGNLTTRWSSNGDGQWIQYDLGSSKTVSYIKLAPYSGVTRTFTFDIQTSSDNVTFTTARSNAITSLSDALQTFDFTDVSNARYVRIIGHGNSSTTWNSYSEVEIYGRNGAGTGTSAVNVSTIAQLTSAISNATAGTTIVLANGTYSAAGPIQIVGKNGTASNPIKLIAANQGQAIIAGGAFFYVQNSSYVTIEGLKFTEPGSSTNTAFDKSAVILDGSNNISLTRNLFVLSESGVNSMWVQVRGVNSHHNRIDHNEFGGKKDTAPLIAYEGDGNGNISQYDTIEYNYFHDVGPWVANGKETIRLGLSGISLSNGYNTIQYNLFENCDGEPEIVSVKSSNNTVRYNTFKTSKGGLTSRHGHSNSFYGNFFLGDGVETEEAGIRIYGNDHKIYNNYMEKLTQSAIIVDSGTFDGGTGGYPANPTPTELTAQWKVYRAQVVNNTIVNSTSGIIVGSSKTYAPEGVKVANNIVKNSTGTLYNEAATTNTVFEGNIGYGSTLNNKSRTTAEIRLVDPLFGTWNGLQKLSSTSTAAINSAVGSYPFVIKDMDGETRSTNDVGADEYSASTSIPAIHQLTSSEVGTNAP